MTIAPRRKRETAFDLTWRLVTRLLILVSMPR